MWVYIFAFSKERLRGEKTTKAGRKEGGRGCEVREISLCPAKMDTMSSFADMMADYGSCQHCLHVLMYTRDTHVLTCSHIARTHTHTHTHTHTPKPPVPRRSLIQVLNSPNTA